MNREIELLRAVEYQLDSFIEGGYFPNAHVLLDTVKELLAQTEQEPDLWVVTNPWGVNEYLWSEPREQVYENYKVTKFYRSPLVNKHTT